jgi:alpha-ribazole phosphatase/probable phosphoglycerate mutase
MMTRVWLIRHGKPMDRAKNRCYGKLDIGLSEEGRLQMAKVAEYLAATPPDVVYASPLSRATESAAILGDFQVEEKLAEIDFGDFEGLLYDEIAVKYPALYRRWMETPTKVRFPNGECFAEMKARVLGAFQFLLARHDGESMALVSHGGVNRIIIAWALQMPDHCLFRLAQPYAAINLLEFYDGVPTLRLMAQAD